MRCGDPFAHTKGAEPELPCEPLGADNPKALWFSTGAVATRRWQCTCGWARYEVWTAQLAVSTEDIKTARLCGCGTFHGPSERCGPA